MYMYIVVFSHSGDAGFHSTQKWGRAWLGFYVADYGRLSRCPHCRVYGSSCSSTGYDFLLRGSEFAPLLALPCERVSATAVYYMFFASHDGNYCDYVDRDMKE